MGRMVERQRERLQAWAVEVAVQMEAAQQERVMVVRRRERPLGQEGGRVVAEPEGQAGQAHSALRHRRHGRRVVGVVEVAQM